MGDLPPQGFLSFKYCPKELRFALTFDVISDQVYHLQGPPGAGKCKTERVVRDWSKWLPSWSVGASRRLGRGKFQATWMWESQSSPELQEPAFRRWHDVTWLLILTWKTPRWPGGAGKGILAETQAFSSLPLHRRSPAAGQPSVSRVNLPGKPCHQAYLHISK